MATSNFKSMDGFPLIVAEDIYEKVCPECGCGNSHDAEKCDACGASLAEAEAVYDECLMQERVQEMENFASQINEKVEDFFKVSVERGYYSGVQFYVEDKTWKFEEITNEEAHDSYGCCRSAAIRLYKKAKNTVVRELHRAKKELGLMEIAVYARFSNGETWYNKVE